MNISTYIAIGAFLISVLSLWLSFRKYEFDKSQYRADLLSQIKNYFAQGQLHIDKFISEIEDCKQELLSKNVPHAEIESLVKDYIDKVSYFKKRLQDMENKLDNSRVSHDPIDLRFSLVEASQLLEHLRYFHSFAMNSLYKILAMANKKTDK